MLDLVRLYLRAGDGGPGRVSFFRNRRVLKGGPNGGDGGDGGHVIIRLDPKLNTLQHFSGQKQFIATDGQRGGKARQIGRAGEDVELTVPAGTSVWLYSENQVSQQRRELYGIKKFINREDLPRVKYFVDKETNPPPPRTGDDIESTVRPRFRDFLHARREGPEAEFAPLTPDQLSLLVTIDEQTPEVVICQGGFGGRGNDTFKSAHNTTPLEAEYGTFGEQKLIFLELKLLANIGLVGLPNAGKSTLLSRLTKAQPKVADYPFTTLEPHLGVLDFEDGRSLVLADIPGLISGASQGRGLGFDFLRHLEHCRALVFVLALAPETIFNEQISPEAQVQQLVAQYRVLAAELANYSDKLGKKRRLIVINKLDLYPESLVAAIKAAFAGESVVGVSAATGQGLAQLRAGLWREFAGE